RQVVLSTGKVTTIAGAAGQPGNVDGDIGAARFDQPSGLVLDTDSRRLYVADAGNKSIRRIDLAEAGVTTLQVTVAPDESFDGFVFPADVAREGNRLFVADAGSHAVFVIDSESLEAKVL